jgi:hypothetical protein
MPTFADAAEKLQAQLDAKERDIARALGQKGIGTSPNEPILQFFSYSHLRPELAAVSRPFCELAEGIIQNLPRNAERTVALRKLLESKDAAVRAFIAVPA